MGLVIIVMTTRLRSASASRAAASTTALEGLVRQSYFAVRGSGDEAAFTALYVQTCLRLLGLVLKVLKDPASAEQVTEEVYLHLWGTAGATTSRAAVPWPG